MDKADKNIYGNRFSLEGKSGKKYDFTLYDDANNIDPVVYIDCDKPLSLMDMIVSVRNKCNVLPIDQTIIIYVTCGSSTRNGYYGWKFFWDYLDELDHKFIIAFRGIFPIGAETILDKKFDNVEMYAVDGIEYFGSVQGFIGKLTIKS